MKKFMLMCLAAICFAGTAAAQTPAAKKTAGSTAVTTFVTDIDCEHCAKKILNNVPALGKGVKDVQVDVPSKQVTVTYDPAKTNDAALVKGFASLRVKAQPVPAGQAK